MTPKHTKEIRDFVEDLYQNGEIENVVKDYLLDGVYLLPKIHKGKLPPPGRPVIAGIGSPTEKISQLVDHFLNPYSKKVKSYVQDTNDFLRGIQAFESVPEGTMLVTMDVTSLYTNIHVPNREGLRAAVQCLDSNH